jgi:hypothetical protein
VRPRVVRQSPEGNPGPDLLQEAGVLPRADGGDRRVDPGLEVPAQVGVAAAASIVVMPIHRAPPSKIREATTTTTTTTMMIGGFFFFARFGDSLLPSRKARRYK